MTKIYNAKTFLEADRIIAALESLHISATKNEIHTMDVITGKMEPSFEIYVSENRADDAMKCIEQCLSSNTGTSGSSRTARIVALAVLGILAVCLCLIFMF